MDIVNDIIVKVPSSQVLLLFTTAFDAEIFIDWLEECKEGFEKVLDKAYENDGR